MNIITLCGDFNNILNALAISDFVCDAVILILPLPTVSIDTALLLQTDSLLMVLDLEVTYANTTEACCDLFLCTW